MGFEWSDDLATGVSDIDEQHKTLITMVNTLLDAGMQGRGKEVVGDALDFLVDYTREHFEDEERLQVELMYPGYNAHKEQHEDFMDQIESLRSEFRENGATLPVAIGVKQLVLDWLISHIKKEDRALARYSRELFS